MAVMLELQNVSSGYGAIEALKAINLRIDHGEIVTLIGANGAGKSTTLRNITGLVPVTAGDAVLVPPGVDHGFRNTGTEPLRLILLWGEPQAAG